MNNHTIASLPSPRELKDELPQALDHAAFIEQTRLSIQNILEGTDPRLLLVTGPCSIHDHISAKEYATRLHKLSTEISDVFLVIMRVYFEKPRTTLGWKGMLYDPKLDSSYDMNLGFRETRRLLLDLADMEVPTGAEFLDPTAACYFSDLISWGCIGARTAESQTHRQMASALPMPVAFKNSTTGNVEIAVNGILSASHRHTYIGIDEAGCISILCSNGNKHGHLVLRGGNNTPNYDPLSLSQALDVLQNASLPRNLIIDCSHDNAKHDHTEQAIVFQSVIRQHAEGNKNIRGLVLESHLHAGSQSLNADKAPLKYAISLTDPCLDWETTEKLIRWGHTHLKKTTANFQADRHSFETNS